MKKRWLYLLFVTVAMLALSIISMDGSLQTAGFFNGSYSRDVHIVINEVMAVNHTGITDEDGDRGDWIELYNPGVMPVNLSGYGLSDKQDMPHLWVFPDITVLPGEYLLVWADGKDRVSYAGLHTNFKVSAGEVITLSNPSGTLVDSIHLNRIIPNISYGRLLMEPDIHSLLRVLPAEVILIPFWIPPHILLRFHLPSFPGKAVSTARNSNWLSAVLIPTQLFVIPWTGQNLPSTLLFMRNQLLSGRGRGNQTFILQKPGFPLMTGRLLKKCSRAQL